LLSPAERTERREEREGKGTQVATTHLCRRTRYLCSSCRIVRRQHLGSLPLALHRCFAARSARPGM